MALVAVCEDDAAVRSVLKRALEQDGHEVVAVGSAQALFAQLEPRPQALVLDLGLPDADGRDVSVALRARGCDAPILMLTALDGLHHKVEGFEAGADDYMTKPFDIPELLVRVRALVRRSAVEVEIDAEDVLLDPARHVISHASVTVDLTPTEFQLAGRLLASRGEAVRRHALVAAGWPHGAYVSDNTLDSYVRRIRTKLRTLGVAERLVTVRGVGYRWD